MTKTLRGVLLDVTIDWHYIYQDARRTWMDISKMRSSGKYSPSQKNPTSTGI